MAREIDTDALADARYASVDPQYQDDEPRMTYNEWFSEARLKSMIHLDRAKDLVEDAADEIRRAVELEPEPSDKKALRRTQKHIELLFGEIEDLL